MTLTLLLDLDNTLLGNDMRDFLPAYLRALSDHLKPYVDPERMIPTLLTATREMIANNDPRRTLKEIFDAAFFTALQIEVAELQPAIDDFYRDVFHTLRPLSVPQPHAVDLVESALARGYQVAIATSPLFPRSAIVQRLEWAGLPPENYPFALVSTYEAFHFAKPNPSYFAEVLGHLGWTEGPVVMVGDDLQNDITPARCLELATFWISPEPAPYAIDSGPPHGQGDISEVLPWIDGLSEQELTPYFQDPPAVMSVLRSTPAALYALSNDLTAQDCKRRPISSEWSPTEILCHLRDVERDVHLQRLEVILRESNPFLPSTDTDAWADERRYNRQDWSVALNEFTIARMTTLDLLEQLAPDQWQQTARHSIFGPTDLKELMRIVAGHDRLHIHQFKETRSRLQRAEGWIPETHGLSMADRSR